MKTVALVLYGPSLKIFEERGKEFQKFDWDWATLHWPHFVMPILKKNGLKLDTIFFFAEGRERDSDLLKESLDDCKTIYTHQKWMKKIYPEKCRDFNWGGPISLCAFLGWAEDTNVKRVILFGADGHSGEHRFYKQYDWLPRDYSGETKSFNDWYTPGNVEVLNCSLESSYTPLKKISYDDLIGE